MCVSSGVTWVSGVKSYLSAQLWSVMMGILEVAAPLSTTRWEERSSACSDKTAHLQTGPSDSETPHLQCPGESRGGKLHQGLNRSKWGRRVWSVITQQTAGSLKWWNISVVWMWCFSPPERPVPTACRPPAPLWLMEARLSSGVIVQSKTGTQRESSNLKTNDSLLNTLVWFKLCVCVYLQRTSTLTWQSEPQEIWVTELLEVGDRNYWRLVSNIYNLYFVLTSTHSQKL